MPIVPLRNFGKYGVVADSQDQALPIGTWSDARNVRFSGLSMEKMLEPTLEMAFSSTNIDGPGAGYECDAFAQQAQLNSQMFYLLGDEYTDYDADHWGYPDQNGGPILLADKAQATPNYNYAILPDACGTCLRYDYSNTNSSFISAPLVEYNGTLTGSWSSGALYQSWNHAGSSENIPFISIGGTINDDIHGVQNRIGIQLYSTGYNINHHELRLQLDQSLSGSGDTRAVVNWDDIDHNWNDPMWMHVEAQVSINNAPGGGNELAITRSAQAYINGALVLSVTATDTQIAGWGHGNWTIENIYANPFASGSYRDIHVRNFYANTGSTDLAALQDGYDRSFSSYTPPVPTFASPKWLQGWSDGLSTYFAVAAESVDGSDYLLFWKSASDGAGRWLVAGGPYETGQWQSFEWGDTVIFNNGNGAPQVFDQNTLSFIDLPNWGLISTADDITNNTNPSKDTAARCKCIVPLKGFLVALGITESGVYQPNTVWWSDSTSLAGLSTKTGGGPPSWDYESPSTLSGKAEVGVGSGALTWGAVLNENLICYTDASATAMQVTGGRTVMSFRRLFNKGCAGLNLAAEFNNQHFVVARDQLYVHDGSSVHLIAKDRIEEEFFRRAGKGGRFGGGDIDFTTMQVVKNPDRKEINILFGENDTLGIVRTALVYNFEDNNYTWMDASVDAATSLTDVACMHYAFDPGWVVRWSDLTDNIEANYWGDAVGTYPLSLYDQGTRWSDFYHHGTEKNLYWLASDGVYRSDQAVKTDGVKEYFVERVGIDLDDLNASWTTNKMKHLKQFYFHAQSPTPVTGANNFDFTVGWAKTLMDTPDWEPSVTVSLQDSDNTGDYKADFRTTGRYLSINMNFNTTAEVKMSGGDMDASESHGR